MRKRKILLQKNHQAKRKYLPFQKLLEAMSKTSSTSSGETKQDDTQLHFLGAKLIPSATTKEEHNSTDLVRWTAIFSY
jgi:hypothetical protein